MILRYRWLKCSLLSSSFQQIGEHLKTHFTLLIVGCFVIRFLGTKISYNNIIQYSTLKIYIKLTSLILLCFAFLNSGNESNSSIYKSTLLWKIMTAKTNLPTCLMISSFLLTWHQILPPFPTCYSSTLQLAFQF